MEHEIEHEFPLALQQLWQLTLLDERFIRALYEHLRLRIEHLAIECHGADESLTARRVVQFVPDREIPAPIRKLLGSARTVTETSELSARARRLDVRVELPVIGKRTELGGHYAFFELPGATVRRVWHGHCRARLPLVGSVVERYVLRELEASQQAVQRFTVDWISGGAG